MKSKNLWNKIWQGRLSVYRGILNGIIITENESKLWKRYVAKQYKDGQLIASSPADRLCDIDLLYFVK